MQELVDSAQNKSQYFSQREVGLNSPTTPAFIRLRDNGDIEIMAGNQLGIVISKQRQKILLIADEIQFVTHNNQGLRWDNLDFNPNSVRYTEPALLEHDKMIAPPGLYDGVDYYLQS